MSVNLTQKILDDLFGIYKEVTGCTWERNPRLEDVQKYIELMGKYEYRAGSKWSGNSKFEISDSGEIYFYPNCEPLDKKEGREIKRAEKLFKKRVNDYFAKLVSLA